MKSDLMSHLGRWAQYSAKAWRNQNRHVIFCDGFIKVPTGPVQVYVVTEMTGYAEDGTDVVGVFTSPEKARKSLRDRGFVVGYVYGPEDEFWYLRNDETGARTTDAHILRVPFV